MLFWYLAANCIFMRTEGTVTHLCYISAITLLSDKSEKRGLSLGMKVTIEVQKIVSVVDEGKKGFLIR